MLGNKYRMGWYHNEGFSLSCRDVPFITWSIQVQRAMFPALAGMNWKNKFITCLYPGIIDAYSVIRFDLATLILYPCRIKAKAAPVIPPTKTKTGPPTHLEGRAFVVNSTPFCSLEGASEGDIRWIPPSLTRLIETPCLPHNRDGDRFSGHSFPFSAPTFRLHWLSFGSWVGQAQQNRIPTRSLGPYTSLATTLMARPIHNSWR